MVAKKCLNPLARELSFCRCVPAAFAGRQNKLIIPQMRLPLILPVDRKEGIVLVQRDIYSDAGCLMLAVASRSQLIVLVISLMLTTYGLREVDFWRIWWDNAKVFTQ